MTQRLSERGAAFVRHHEGFVDRWYLDPVGVPTIGVGFTWLSASFREWWDRNRPGEAFAKGAKMTRAEADACLIFMFAMEYGKAVGDFYGDVVKQHVFDGTASPVYNLGPGSLKWKWAAAAKAGKLKEAANLLKTTGTTAKGVKLKGLVIRRQEEAELLEHGDYDIGTNVVYSDPMADGMLVRGERGSAVIDLQSRLRSLGLYTGKLDGNFGHGTEAAVLEFQRANGLTPDGYAGPNTLKALGSPAKPVEPSKPIPRPYAPEPDPAPRKPLQKERHATNIGAVVLAIIALIIVGAVIFFVRF